MPKFEPKYVRFMRSDKLDGKMAFFADSISSLEVIVENNVSRYYGEVAQVGNYSPFQIAHSKEPWTFCYYDPLYELKWAYEQGITIQAKLSENMWVDIIEPSWEDSPECYRIKPDEPKESKPVTNRELARWLAQGNGELLLGRTISTDYVYFSDDANSHIDNNYAIRKWTDSEWHEPTREYMGLEE